MSDARRLRCVTSDAGHDLHVTSGSGDIFVTQVGGPEGDNHNERVQEDLAAHDLSTPAHSQTHNNPGEGISLISQSIFNQCSLNCISTIF